MCDLKSKARAGQFGLSGESGQIVVEYILLLVIGVTIATVITTSLVSRSEDSPGFLIVKWRSVIETIGADYADDLSN